MEISYNLSNVEKILPHSVERKEKILVICRGQGGVDSVQELGHFSPGIVRQADLKYNEKSNL